MAQHLIDLGANPKNEAALSEAIRLNHLDFAQKRFEFRPNITVIKI